MCLILCNFSLVAIIAFRYTSFYFGSIVSVPSVQFSLAVSPFGIFRFASVRFGSLRLFAFTSYYSGGVTERTLDSNVPSVRCQRLLQTVT